MREEEGREPGKGKIFAVYANSNSKEKWIHPSSTQVSTPLFEGVAITADMCVTPDFTHAHGRISSCVPGRSSLASQFTALRTEASPISLCRLAHLWIRMLKESKRLIVFSLDPPELFTSELKNMTVLSDLGFS